MQVNLEENSFKSTTSELARLRLNNLDQLKSPNLLMGLDVQLKIGGQAVPQVRPDPALDVVVQPRLVDVDHQRIRMEGVVEVVDHHRQPPDLLAHRLADFLLHVLSDGPVLEQEH